MNHVDQWLEYLRAERRYSELTVRAYADDVRCFIEYTDQKIEEYDPCKTTFQDLRSYVMWRIEGGDSPRSMNRRIASLRSFFKYLIRKEVITKDPTARIKSLPQESKLPEFVPEKKITELITQLFKEFEDPHGRRDAMIVILLFATGIRRAELVSLKRGDIDTANRTIRVRGKGAKERMIPLVGEVAELLERFLKGSDGEEICSNGENFVFLRDEIKPITTDDVYRVVRRVLGEAGVNGKKSPHVLRHTFATMLMNEGAPMKSIQELLGHSSLNSTQVYTHNTVERLKESYAKAHPRAKE